LDLLSSVILQQDGVPAHYAADVCLPWTSSSTVDWTWTSHLA